MDNLEYELIPKDTYLFRVASNIFKYKDYEGLKKNQLECGDTGKVGIYFATIPILSLAICLEYDKLLEFGIFKTTDEIKISKGKYMFRFLHPERYFKVGRLPENQDEFDDIIDNVKTQSDDFISHIQCELEPLIEYNQEQNTASYLIEDETKSKELHDKGSCEVFLTDQYGDLKKIKFIQGYIFNNEKIKNVRKDILEYMQKNDYPFYLDKYLQDKILLVNINESIKTLAYFSYKINNGSFDSDLLSNYQNMKSEIIKYFRTII
jgi:hypothetical protein